MSTHPQDLTDEQRREGTAALHDRFASAMSRVAADPRNSKAVRAANSRDARVARAAAAKARRS